MTESQALRWINIAGMAVVTVAVLGLYALEAGSSAIALGVIVPTIVMARLCARVVMHYGDDADERERPRR